MLHHLPTRSKARTGSLHSMWANSLYDYEESALHMRTSWVWNTNQASSLHNMQNGTWMPYSESALHHLLLEGRMRNEAGSLYDLHHGFRMSNQKGSLHHLQLWAKKPVPAKFLTPLVSKFAAPGMLRERNVYHELFVLQKLDVFHDKSAVRYQWLSVAPSLRHAQHRLQRLVSATSQREARRVFSNWKLKLRKGGWSWINRPFCMLVYFHVVSRCYLMIYRSGCFLLLTIYRDC